MSAESLNANPVDTIIEAITTPETVVSVNDTTIDAIANAAQNLEGDAIVNAQRADELNIKQSTHENLAIQRFSNAEGASTENAYFAHESAGEVHENIAISANVTGNTAAIASHEDSAISATLHETATIQIAVADVEKRTIMAQTEVEDRTHAGVKEEMRVMDAVVSDPNSAQNLEAQAKMAATIENDTPTFKA